MLAACLLMVLSSTLYAHPPKDVTLSYDAGAQVLSVTITHSTFFPSKHYVKMLEIRKNGTEVSSTPYSSQPDSDTFTYTFPMKASPGDEISATAICNVFGAKAGTIVLPK